MLLLHRQTVPYFQRLLQRFRVDSLTLTDFSLELSFKSRLLFVELAHPVLNVAEKHIVRIGKSAHELAYLLIDLDNFCSHGFAVRIGFCAFVLCDNELFDTLAHFLIHNIFDLIGLQLRCVIVATACHSFSSVIVKITVCSALLVGAVIDVHRISAVTAFHHSHKP